MSNSTTSQYYGLFPKVYLARKRKNPGRIGYLLRVLLVFLESMINAHLLF